MSVNDDLEEILKRVEPRPPAPELRDHVLASVARELNRQAEARRRRLAVLAVAASLALVVGMNLWIGRRVDARLAQLIGPALPDRQAMEIARDVAALTDEATGHWIYERLTAGRRQEVDYRRWYARYQETLNELIRTGDGSGQIPRPRRTSDQRGPRGRPAVV